MDNSSIVFLGKTVPHELAAIFYSKSKNTMQDAAIAFQSKIIRGLEENLHVPLNIFNLLPISSYPKYYSDAVVNSFSYSHATGANDYNVGFLNIAYIKRLFIGHSYLKHFKRYLKNSDTDVLIGYSMDLSFLKAMKAAKAKFPIIITCVIVPDMPEFNDLSSNMSCVRKKYMAYIEKKTRTLLRYVDSFVYVTEQSAEYLCNNKPYTVIEGIADEALYEKQSETVNRLKKIIYTGTTNKMFGVMNLVKSFRMIMGNEYRLIIAGCGDSDVDIKKAAEEDDRIDFRGIVPHSETLKLQREATVLVNPRQNIGEYTKYSFPLKTMEYLSSGVPVVAYKLDGIADEYDQYISYVPDNSIKTLAETLKATCDIDDDKRHYMGKCAREYIIKNKSAKSQMSKLVSMLNSIRKGEE